MLQSLLVYLILKAILLRDRPQDLLPNYQPTEHFREVIITPILMSMVHLVMVTE